MRTGSKKFQSRISYNYNAKYLTLRGENYCKNYPNYKISAK